MTAGVPRDIAALREAINAARSQHRAGAGAVLDILLRDGTDRAAWAAALEERAGVDVWQSGGEFAPDFSVWDRSAAREARCVVLRNGQGRLLAAAEDPWDEALLQVVAQRLGVRPAPMAASRETLLAWLGEPAVKPAPTEAGVLAEGPIVEFVDQAIRAAYRAFASDVHFECDRGGVTVRHRIDGVLVAFARMEGVQASQEAISRIKVLSHLDITERRQPQDGRMRLMLAEGELDLRVSIMPSVHGEDAVLRLLDKARSEAHGGAVTLDILGFDAREAARIRDLALLPSGMVLVTGPTGSGKTTTVYASLSEINTGREKIITIEDPVEYELAGVLQIPVNERKGLTFARGLRSILRHDPDRILVGEIRDAETAEIAIQSALTGHSVFTTVHANSLGDVVGRFRHFGLDMFGFMSALNGMVVQRLLRCLCRTCAATRLPTQAEQHWAERVAPIMPERTFGAIGCAACHGTGYKGRFVVAEVHVLDDALRDRIIEGAPLSSLKAHSLAQGVEPLLLQALRAAENGRTTIEEVRRVVGG